MAYWEWTVLIRRLKQNREKWTRTNTATEEGPFYVLWHSTQEASWFDRKQKSETGRIILNPFFVCFWLAVVIFTTSSWAKFAVKSLLASPAINFIKNKNKSQLIQSFSVYKYKCVCYRMGAHSLASTDFITLVFAPHSFGMCASAAVCRRT